MKHRLAIDGHVLTGKFQGSRTVLSRLVEALQKEGLADRVVLFSEEPASLQKDFPGVEHREIPPCSGVRRLLFEFPRLLKAADVRFALFNYIAPPFSPAGTVVIMHDVLPLTHPHYFPLAFALRFRLLTFLTMLQARLVLTVSEASASSIRRLHPFAGRKVEVLPLGPSFEESVYAAARPDPGRRPYILAVGRIERRKNMKLLVDAFLRADLADVDLVIVGANHMGYEWDVPDDPRIRRLANVPDAELAEIYKGASLFVYPSSAEGFGIPLLDATLFGLPVISSSLTSMPEVAGPLASYFDPEAENALETLSGLIDGHFQGRALAGANPEQVRSQMGRFSWRAMARRFAHLIDALN